MPAKGPFEKHSEINSRNNRKSKRSIIQQGLHGTPPLNGLRIIKIKARRKIFEESSFPIVHLRHAFIKIIGQRSAS
jgi:hypothetical protein